MKISTILDHIDSGHMALPEFQRGYVWNSDQVRKLLTSLYLRRPVGGLLVGPPSRERPRKGGRERTVFWGAPGQVGVDLKRNGRKRDWTCRGQNG